MSYLIYIIGFTPLLLINISNKDWFNAILITIIILLDITWFIREIKSNRYS